MLASIWSNKQGFYVQTDEGKILFKGINNLNECYVKLKEFGFYPGSNAFIKKEACI